MTSGAPSSETLDQTALDWAFDAGLVEKVLMNANAKIRARRRRRSMVAAAAVVALGLAWGVPYFKDTASFETRAAQREMLALQDGSRAVLSGRTKLQTDFRYGRRSLRLEQGEAFFKVAKDKAHPFLVATPAGTIRVTGTQFDVRLMENGGTEVTLLEGSVLVQRDGLVDQALRPGERLAFDQTAAKKTILSEIEREDASAWRSGRFVLDGKSLTEVAARLSAYYGCEISVSSKLAELRPGGSCPLTDLPSVLAGLQKALPVLVVSNPNGTYRIVAR